MGLRRRREHKTRVYKREIHRTRRRILKDVICKKMNDEINIHLHTKYYNCYNDLKSKNNKHKNMTKCRYFDRDCKYLNNLYC